jgi:RNase adaptor protein for sRNA GlmZ degradation
MELDHIALTDKERVELERNLAEYEQRCEQERARDAEYAARPFRTDNWIPDLYDEFIRRNTQYISECHQTIGVLIRVRERFRSDQEMQQLIRELIDYEQSEIDMLMKEIERDKETAGKFRELRRG